MGDQSRGGGGGGGGGGLYNSSQGCRDQVSFFLGHLSGGAPGVGSGSLSCKEGQMPLSSCYSSSGGGVEDSWLYGRMKSMDQDLGSLDCESEVEGVDMCEAQAKPAPARGSSSKRSRAAEVHNMSEKRRRSRINEKMKALQNLIPNSNKTDKASMLDEAIEYLKQLQLQVQMLSMRNGISLHPMHLSGDLQPLLASHMYFSLGLDKDREPYIGMGMLPSDPDFSSQCSFDLPCHGASSRHSTMIPTLTSMRCSEASVAPKSLQSQHGSFHLPVSTSKEVFPGDIVTQQQLASNRAMENVAGNKKRSMGVDASRRQFGEQAPSMAVSNHLENCMLIRERSLEMFPKEPDNHI